MQEFSEYCLSQHKRISSLSGQLEGARQAEDEREEISRRGNLLHQGFTISNGDSEVKIV
jgi:hypothetical protein